MTDRRLEEAIRHLHPPVRTKLWPRADEGGVVRQAVGASIPWLRVFVEGVVIVGSILLALGI